MLALKQSAKRLIERWAPGVADRIHSRRADAVIRRKNRESGLAELEDRFLAEHGSQVTGGIFVGMTYLPEAKGSVLIPKLLGTYEKEIAPWMIDIVAARPVRIIDVGCAEGYYAVGLARLLPETEVFAFDINTSAQRLCRRLAELNGVGGRVRVGGRCRQEDLQLLAGSGTVLICDIEGAEGAFLDPAAIPALFQTTLVIELHDCLVPGVADVVRGRFATSHNCEEMAAEERAPQELSAVSENQGRLMLSEFRVPGQSWLRLRPLTTDH